MQKKFKDVQDSVVKLKKKFRQGKISQQEYIDRLKKLRLKTEDGRFWTIGEQSGKWYYFDGMEWIQSSPPSIKDGKAICIYCGFENELETEICGGCGGELVERKEFIPEVSDKVAVTPSDSGYLIDESKVLEEEKEELLSLSDEHTNFILRSISPTSFFIFCGALGIPLGIILGALAGASNYFSFVVGIMPAFLKGIQGTLLGGIISGSLGGVLGFIVFGVCGFLAALVINLVSSFTGGIRVRIEKIKEE